MEEREFIFDGGKVVFDELLMNETSLITLQNEGSMEVTSLTIEEQTIHIHETPFSHLFTSHHWPCAQPGYPAPSSSTPCSRRQSSWPRQTPAPRTQHQ